MKSIVTYVSFGGLLTLAGCALFSQSDPFMEVQPGMEATQVQSLLGTPIDRKFVADHDEWTYRKDLGGGIQKTKVIVFDNQKVVALADDAVAAEREFELAKAHAEAPTYPGYPAANAAPRPGLVPLPGNTTTFAGSPLVLPPTKNENGEAAAVANAPALNPSVGISSAAPAQPVAPPPAIVPPPPSADVAPASEKPAAVAQQKAKHAKKAKVKHHPITEPKSATESR